MNQKTPRPEDPGVRPVRAARRARLDILISEAGGPTELAAMTGTTDTHLIACQRGRREIGDALATKLELGCDKPFGWMDDDGRGWPFESVPRETYARLPPKTRAMIEGYVQGKVAEAGIDTRLGGSAESHGPGLKKAGA